MGCMDGQYVIPGGCKDVRAIGVSRVAASFRTALRATAVKCGSSSRFSIPRAKDHPMTRTARIMGTPMARGFYPGGAFAPLLVFWGRDMCLRESVVVGVYSSPTLCYAKDGAPRHCEDRPRVI